MIAIAPTATIASIAGCYECIEPQVSNLFKRETLSGDFVQINKYLVNELKDRRPLDRRDPQQDQTRRGLGTGHRGIQRRAKSDLPHRVGDPDAFPDRHGSRPRCIHRPVGSRSTCLWRARIIGKLSSMYMYAWQKGLKTTYYLRSRPATRIAQVAAREHRDPGRCRKRRTPTRKHWFAHSRIRKPARRVSK